MPLLISELGKRQPINLTQDQIMTPSKSGPAPNQTFLLHTKTIYRVKARAKNDAIDDDVGILDIIGFRR
jgi:hypothetical protein